MTRGRVVVIGAVHEARPLLQRLLDERPAVVAGLVTLENDLLHNLAGAVDLATMADEAGVPVLRVRNLNSPDNVERLRALSPDLLVAVGWTRLLGADVLAVPRSGCVGFHASLLPANRGRAPVNWALIRGETLGGNTMMLLDAGTDTGDIVDQVPLPFAADDTCGTVYERVAEAGADMLLRNLDRLLSGDAPTTPQDPREGTHNPGRTPDMGVTDWQRTALEIHNWIRGQTHPYPGAFTTLDGDSVHLWRSTVVDEQSTGRPGSIVTSDDAGITVQCGRGRLLVMDWQADGPNPTQLRVGDRFDAVEARTRDWSLGLNGGN